MRILNLVHQYLPERVGGTELYTQAIARAMVARGHTVGVFHRSNRDDPGLLYRDEQGAAVWSASAGVMSPGQRFLASHRQAVLHGAFETVIETFRPDVVHIQHMMGLPVSIAQLLQRARIPYVITLWDFWWRCANAQLLTNDSQQICDGPTRTFLNCARCAVARAGASTGAAARLSGGLLRLPALPLVAPLMARRNALLDAIIRRAARLLAPTPFVAAWYVRRGFPEERVVVLPPALAYPDNITHHGDSGVLRVAYIGGLSAQKGVHVLIEAFAGLHGEAELWVAGDESADPGYSRVLRETASPNVRFLGRLDREDVWKTLAQVDVVAVPTLWYETYSFIISEAFVAGAPVLVSRLGPLADRVRDGVDGLLLPPGDVSSWRGALQSLVDTPGRLGNLRSGVRQPESLTEHAAQLEALLRGVTQELAAPEVTRSAP